MTPISPADQAKAAVTSALLVPAPDRAALTVTGKDRTSWLNGLVTCDLAKLGPGRAAYGLLVEKKGKIQTDLFVAPHREESVLALAVPASLREAILTTLDHYLIMEDAELVSGDLIFWEAHGPAARELLGLAPFGGELDRTGLGGAFLAAPASERAAVEERLHGALQAAGGALGDEAGWEALRIERGLPRFGVEVDTSMYPQEAGLEKLAVSFDKGCYLGQEVVYMLEHRGHVKRKLVGLALEGDAPPAVGAAVTTLAGDAVGEVKSAAVGPVSGRAVAIAMVKWAAAKPGTELRVGDASARVR
jgi:tRNA-modifying protein YgfZ